MLAALPRIARGTLLVCCAWAASQGPVRGDAIIRTQAMLASTIAEFYVEDGRVLFELEIGPEDLQAFRNLFPDEIHERLGHPPRAVTERLLEFFAEDLIIAVEDGVPLPGRILEMGPRPSGALRSPPEPVGSAGAPGVDTVHTHQTLDRARTSLIV